MPAPYGNVGQTLITFERDLTVVRKGESQIVDGYVEESLEQEVSFRGVIVPVYTLRLEDIGMHIKGDSILYVRITQPSAPEIHINDIVKDGKGQCWKVLGMDDYSEHGKVLLYDIQKVNPPC